MTHFNDDNENGWLHVPEDPDLGYNMPIERTYSEFRLSVYGRGAGSPGTGTWAPDVFTTSQPGNPIATCQDCGGAMKVIACII